MGEGRGGGAAAAPAGSRDLELRRLLGRFTDVCNAIDYAHSRGVLHRDIKPGNIIVGKHGETLDVDWGAWLTTEVGRVTDALAAHRSVLAARRALAAEPGAGAAVRAEEGRSLITVAGI